MLKKILQAIGYMLSYIYTYNLSLKFKAVFDCIYTGWIKRSFKKFEGYAEYGIIVHDPQCISIGKNTHICKRARLTAWTHFLGHEYKPSIEIGENCSFGSDCFLSAINGIKIGNNVAVTARTLVLDNVHGNFKESDFTFKNNPHIPDVFLQNVKTRELHSAGPIIIEDDVHIGENCVILPNVTIGHNSVISANSVVMKNIPPYSIVAGNPGRVVMSFGK